MARPCSEYRPEGASEAKSSPPPNKNKKNHSFCFLRPNRGTENIDSALKRHVRPAHLPSQSPRQTAPPGLATHPPANRSLDFKVHQPQRPKIAIQRLKTKTEKRAPSETKQQRDKERQEDTETKRSKTQSERERKSDRARNRESDSERTTSNIYTLE